MQVAASSNETKTAFVFAGGGSMGAVQVGMVRALFEAGVKPDIVVGSSVGAINAAYLAGAPDIDGIDRLAQLWRGIRRTDVFPFHWRRLFGFIRSGGHLVPADGLRQLISHNLAFARIEEAKIPLCVIATDVTTGEPVSITAGPATQAILASTAIPGAFEPISIDGVTLCDGGISSNTPVAAAIAAGARRLFVLPTGYASAKGAPPRGAMESALHAITLMTGRQLAAELDQIGRKAVVHILPAACPRRISPFDFSATAELIEHAYNGATEWLRNAETSRGATIGPCNRAAPHLLSNRKERVQSKRARALAGSLNGLAMPA